jgi:hypothetical protein
MSAMIENSALSSPSFDILYTKSRKMTIAERHPERLSGFFKKADRDFSHIVRGQGVQVVLPEVGVLLVFAAIFFVVGVWRLRFE